MSDTQLKTPQQMLLHWEQMAPDRIYLRQPINRQWREFSWREVADQARRMATALRGFGLQPGDRVGIFSKNCAEWIISDLAIMVGGFISVPVYSSANADTLGYCLKHAEAKAVFIGKLDKAEGLEKAIPDGCISIAYPYPTLPTDHQWDDLIGANEPTGEVASPSLDDVMTILYTSGSTGNPKGAVHTYGSYAYAGTSIALTFGVTDQSKALSYLPMAHCTDRAYVEASSLYSSMQVSFTESLETFFDDLKATKPTMFGSVPRLWKRFQLGVLAKNPQSKLNWMLKVPLLGGVVKRKIADGLGLSESTWNGSGAAPIAPALLEWWNSIDIPIYEGWGMTETLAYATQAWPGIPQRIGTVGRAMPGVVLKTTEAGELLVKSPTLMREYYKEPEKTAEEFTEDGFFKTGDRAAIDADGYVKITGRVKEIFKTAKGKYVAPVPIESLLSQNEFVEQVCVVGMGRKQPVALIQLPEGQQVDKATASASLESTMSQINGGLESHARMDRIIVIDEPWTPENGIMTPTQKIKRHLVEKRYETLISAEDGPKILFE